MSFRKNFIALLVLSATSWMSSAQASQIIDDAIAGLITGCSVTYRGGFNQLYVNGVFKGNFTRGYDDYNLENTLYRNINAGNCYYSRTRSEVSVNDPNLVRDFERGMYANCTVVPNAGLLQLYVDGTFRGNFSQDERALRTRLVYLVNQRVCVRRPSTPTHPRPAVTCELNGYVASGVTRAEALASVLNLCQRSRYSCRASDARCRPFDGR